MYPSGSASESTLPSLKAGDCFEVGLAAFVGVDGGNEWSVSSVSKVFPFADGDVGGSNGFVMFVGFVVQGRGLMLGDVVFVMLSLFLLWMPYCDCE